METKILNGKINVKYQTLPVVPLPIKRLLYQLTSVRFNPTEN